MLRADNQSLHAAIETRCAYPKPFRRLLWRYRYEECGLFNLQSLLIKPVLQPDGLALSRLARLRRAARKSARFAGDGAQS